MLPNEFTKTSETAKFLVTLLNNAEELVALSNKRKEAEDVLKAFKIYAHGKGFPIPQDKVDNFSSILLDARPITLSYLLRSIAGDVMAADNKRRRAVGKQEKKRKLEAEDDAIAEADAEPSEE